MTTEGRVLSIQSHVVRGYVGNKCSVFTLQLLGFDVDPVNSVQFSNHTGYPTFKGTILQGAELANLVEGLEANELLDGYTHMLTGYIGSSSFLRSVMGAYETLKAANPDMLFICDPVLGDEGRLYVPAENVDVYREEVLPLATMLTPNQFEAELLSGVKILTQEDAVRACMALHARGPDTVVITSNHLRDPEFRKDDIVLIASTRRRPRSLSRSRRANPEAAAPDDAAPASEEVDSDCSLDVVGGRDGNGSNLVDSAEKSRDDAQGPGGEKSVKEGGGKANDDVPRERSTVREPEVDVYRMTFPRLPQQFTGTGDLAAALLLAWTHRLPGDLSAALEKVAGTMRAVLKRTHAEGSAELLLIESKEDIERPPVEIKAVMIPIGPRR